MTYNEVLTAARGQMGPCKACPVCDGRACRNTVPGPGAKGVGDVAIRNYSAWQNVRVNMDTICESGEPDTTLEMFGHSYRIPVFAGPVGAMQLHYGTKYTDLEYNDILVPACHDAGILAFTGDGTNPAVMVGACKAVKANAGFGIPTVKPWDAGTIAEKMALVRATGAFAVAMDIDAAGLPFLKNLNPPAGSKTVEELRGIIADAKVPFIIKGVMTARGAQKAVEASDVYKRQFPTTAGAFWTRCPPQQKFCRKLRRPSMAAARFWWMAASARVWMYLRRWPLAQTPY